VQYSTVHYSTVQYSTVQYSTVQYSTVQYSKVQCSAVQCSAVQYSTVQYSTVQCSTVQYSTVQCRKYSTVQYSTVQYSTVQYSTLQYSTVQYSTQQNFMEICPVRDELFHADRQKDGQTWLSWYLLFAILRTRPQTDNCQHSCNTSPSTFPIRNVISLKHIFIFILFCSQNSRVGSWNVWGSNPSRRKKLPHLQHCTERLWGPTSLTFN